MQSVNSTSANSSPISLASLKFGNKQNPEKKTDKSSTDQFEAQANKKAQTLADQYFASKFLEQPAYFASDPINLAEFFLVMNKKITDFNKSNILSTALQALRIIKAPPIKETVSIENLNLNDPVSQNPRINPVSRMLLSIEQIDRTDFEEEVKLTDQATFAFINRLKLELEMINENKGDKSKQVSGTLSQFEAEASESEMSEASKIISNVKIELKFRTLEQIIKSLNYIDMATDKKAASLLYIKDNAIGLTRVGKIVFERLTTQKTEKEAEGIARRAFKGLEFPPSNKK